MRSFNSFFLSVCMIYAAFQIHLADCASVGLEDIKEWLRNKTKVLALVNLIQGSVGSTTVGLASTTLMDTECEFPPVMEEDLTRIRTKRLTTVSGLVCLEDYPYTVSIRLHDKHWCGGAIVGSQWILSAAQCFDYVNHDEVTVRMGSVYRDFGGRILSIIEIQRHPNYKTNQYYPEHNLAMIKLNMPIQVNKRIKIVALPPADGELPVNFGETVVTGYGSVVTGQIREGENQELRRMLVKEISKSVCRVTYGSDYQLQHDHICLQSMVTGVALCAGDTGDPAVHFSGLSRGGTLFGIALFSGTEECAFKSKPGVFAKVSFSTNWIKDVMNEVPERVSLNTADRNNESVESNEIENSIPSA